MFRVIFHRRQLGWLGLSAVIIFLDQASKILATQYLPWHQAMVVNRFFNWFLSLNKGAAFGLLSQQTGWQTLLLTTIAIMVSVAITGWLMWGKTHSGWQAAGLASILGGAIGNVIDRVMHGQVIDFISWHVGQYYWPTFNIADAAVCIGAILFMIRGDSRDDQRP